MGMALLDATPAARAVAEETRSPMEPTDDEIVARVLAGDAAAFRPLVERHYARCLRYAVRMLGDRADAEEAVQDAFARAYRWLARYEARDRFGAWLFQILTNRCRTIGGQRRRREARFVAFEAVDALPAGGPEAAGARESDDRLEVQRALARLSERDREALLLKYLDDRTYEDIAALLGARVSAIKMRVKRARDLLQRTLEGGDR